MEFNNLATVKFQEKMKPHALKIYKTIFHGCEINDLREHGINVHVLDKEFGIDSLVSFKSGQWISLQEKYRKNYAIRYLDFTQEYMNGDGTQHQSFGEWFKLGAQLYFYGWANKDETDFEKWILMDIAKYKLIVESLGGLQNIGQKRFNKIHGSASFYSIPLDKIKTSFLFNHGICTTPSDPINNPQSI